MIYLYMYISLFAYNLVEYSSWLLKIVLYFGFIFCIVLALFVSFASFNLKGVNKFVADDSLKYFCFHFIFRENRT